MKNINKKCNNTLSITQKTPQLGVCQYPHQWSLTLDRQLHVAFT